MQVHIRVKIHFSKFKNNFRNNFPDTLAVEKIFSYNTTINNFADD